MLLRFTSYFFQSFFKLLKWERLGNLAIYIPGAWIFCHLISFKCLWLQAFIGSQEPAVNKLKEPILDEITAALVSRFELNFTRQDTASLWFLCKQVIKFSFNFAIFAVLIMKQILPFSSCLCKTNSFLLAVFRFD